MGFIYKITNTINGKAYIGQTRRTIKWRFDQHKNCNKKYALYYAIDKYGIKNFKVEQLEECDNSKLDEREIYWIEFYNTYHKGYNMTKGGRTGNKTQKRPVLQYDMKGNFIKRYESLCDACFLNNFNEPQDIFRCCKGKIKYAYGYQWKYENSDKQIVSLLDKEDMKIVQYDKYGNKIKEYDDAKQITESLGIHESTIYRVLTGVRKTANGFVFRRKYQDFNDISFEWKTTKKVNQYDENGNYIKTFDSCIEALKSIGLSRKEHCTFSAHLNKDKTYHGYLWRTV